MRRTGVLFLFVVLLLLSAACGTTNEKREVSSSPQKPIQDKIIITKLQKGTTIQEYELQTQKDEIATYEDSSITEKFIDAIKESEKISGIANVAPPHYEVTIQKDDNESSYYLWININDRTRTSNAMYMNKGDTDNGYKISVKKTNSIIEFLNEVEK